MLVLHHVEREIPFVFIEIHVREGIGLAERAAHAGDGAVESGFAVAFQYDIYDTVVSLRVIFRGRVGHHLDALDLIGWDLVQRQGRLLAIEQDGRRAVAEGDIPCGVDAKRRHLPERILCRASLAGKALVDVEDLFIDLGSENGPAGDDRHFLHLGGYGGQLDDAGVLRSAIYDGDRSGIGFVPHDADLQGHECIRQILQRKIATGLTDDLCGYRRVFT